MIWVDSWRVDLIASSMSLEVQLQQLKISLQSQNKLTSIKSHFIEK